MIEDISDADINSALANIARTLDGRLLYRFLQQTRMRVIGSSESGALQADFGARTFAADLMGRMAQGIAEKSSDYASGGRFDLIVSSNPKPVDSGRQFRGVGHQRRQLAAIPDDPAG